MKCGFYEIDITPPFGSIIPGSFGPRFSNGVLDTLYVRAMVCKTETAAAAIAVIDACGITMDITERILERVTATLPIPKENIMVMATHTHSGGPTLNWGEAIVTDPAYLTALSQKTGDAIIQAWNIAEESELYLGKEEIHDISFIRVFKMKDGSLKTNPGRKNAHLIDEPTTTIDPDVDVLAIKQQGRFIGAMVNFACHPAILFTEKNSGDFISSLAREMKKTYGNDFITLFVNGACGNINHVNPFDPETTKPGRQIVIGEKLAAKVHAAMEGAKPVSGDIKSIADTVPVHFRKPTEEQLLAAKRYFDSLGDDLINCTWNADPNYIETFFALQVFHIQADKRTQRPVYLQLLKIGPVTLFGLPIQMFVQFGKKIKEACDHAFISVFANDYCGYVPVAEQMQEGVYEARLATSSALEPAAGEILTDAAIDMYKRM